MCVREIKWPFPLSFFKIIIIAGDFNSVFCSLKMKKFNIRKVLDGLKEVSSSTPSVQVGPQENHLIQETLQSEHFQLCKVGETGDFYFFPNHTAVCVLAFSANDIYCRQCFALIPSQNTDGASGAPRNYLLAAKRFTLQSSSKLQQARAH